MFRCAQHDSCGKAEMFRCAQHDSFFYRHAGLDPASRWNKESILNLDSGVKHQNDKNGKDLL